MANIKFHTGSNLGPWTYVWFRSNKGREYFSELGHRTTVMNFKDSLNRPGTNSGNFIPTPPPPVINLVDGEEVVNDAAIKNIFRLMYDVKNSPRPRCILPFNDVAIYNSFKTVADTKAGIHAVCCVGPKLMKEQRQDQYFGNVTQVQPQGQWHQPNS
jgi:eukaryotic translation initiation factor 2C